VAAARSGAGKAGYEAVDSAPGKTVAASGAAGDEVLESKTVSVLGAASDAASGKAVVSSAAVGVFSCVVSSTA